MQLNPDESVVKKTGEIGYGTGLSKKNELILTNQRIILIRKNVFGKTRMWFLFHYLRLSSPISRHR